MSPWKWWVAIAGTILIGGALAGVRVPSYLLAESAIVDLAVLGLVAGTWLVA